jgi:Calcineurin-like phosphoesterase
MSESVWIVGDPQGWREPLVRVLAEARLIGVDAHWIGGNATLVLAGDLVDRGPDGIGVIDLLMRLQQEAAGAGGAVHVVIGNHDVQFLAAHYFGDSMRDAWIETGGVLADLEQLTDAHVEWLTQLPAMLKMGDALVLHADALFYGEYGSSLQEVNSAFTRILEGHHRSEWQQLLDRFGEHRTFCGEGGEARLDGFLAKFGARMLVHGHSPIARTLNVPPESVTEAYVYCSGRCVSVDPGIYLGGPGFAYRLT